MVIVAGGGLSGLSAAYYLTKKYSNSKLKLLVLEANKRCGGWVESSNREGYLFEVGPRTIRPKGPVGINTLNLIEELELSDKVIPIKSDHPAALNRMIYAKNKLNLLPNSLPGLLLPKPPFSKPLAFALIQDLISSKNPKLDDDTMYNFVNRRFGKDIADYAISSMLCGICAGDAKEISVKFLMSSLFDMEQKYGGVLKGVLKGGLKSKSKDNPIINKLARRAKDEKWSIYSLEGGLEQLPIRLSKSLSDTGVKTYNDHKIEEILFFNDNKRVCVKIKEDYAFTSEHLFSCLPAHQLASLVKNSHPTLTQQLQEIPFVDVAVINLQYDSDKLLNQKAFGFLVPPIEKLPILGVIFDSCCFPNQKGTVLTVMMGGKWFEDYFGKNPTEDDLLLIAKSQIREILKIKDEPNSFAVNILRKCIPQYVVGHHERLTRIRKYIKDNKLPLSLCGASYDGIGVNDVIMSSKLAVENSNLY